MTWTGFIPELRRFNLRVLGLSKVRSIPKSNISRGENIPGAERERITYIHYFHLRESIKKYDFKLGNKIKGIKYKNTKIFGQ